MGTRLAALIYLALPTAVYLGGFLRWPLAVPALVALAAGLFLAGRSPSATDLPPVAGAGPSAAGHGWKTVLAVALFAVLWSAASGQGGWTCQKWDWNFRNACFRDLITHDWPVFYPRFGNALVYYVGHWLMPAGLVKLLGALGVAVSWQTANVFLLVWTAAGVTIAMLLFLDLVRADSPGRKLLVLGLFVAFAGMDALPAVERVVDFVRGIKDFGIIENWMGNLAFEGNSAQLAWVFHQAVPAWVAVLFVLNDRSLPNVGFVVAILLICAPLPAIGLCLLLAVPTLAIGFGACRNGNFANFCIRCLSPQTALGFVVALCVLPYFHANPQSGAVSCYFWNPYFAGKLIDMAFFFFVEIGVCMLLIWLLGANRYWIAATLAALAVCLSVRVGVRHDFCMRASIPALLAVEALVADCLVRRMGGRRGCAVALLVVLVIGTVAPLCDLAQTVQLTLRHAPREACCDEIGTFDRELDEHRIPEPRSEWDWRGHLNNFYTPDPCSQFFFKWMAGGVALPKIPKEVPLK